MAALAAAQARGRRGGRMNKLTPELRHQVRDVIRNLPIGRTAFHHHFPNEQIREFRGRRQGRGSGLRNESDSGRSPHCKPVLSKP